MRRRISVWMGAMTKVIIMRSVRKNIHAVWVKGGLDTLPKGSYILAPNHHSWWDAYLLWFITRKLGCDFRVLMDDGQLSKFYFFRHLGAIGASEIRTALRFLQSGFLKSDSLKGNVPSVLVIFPEGELSAASKLTQIEKGLDYFSEKAKIPVVPLAMRIVLRGAQLPEAFLNFGEPIAFSPNLSADYISSINALLTDLEADISTFPPEEPAEDYLVWKAPKPRFDERMEKFLALGKFGRSGRGSA